MRRSRFEIRPIRRKPLRLDRTANLPGPTAWQSRPPGTFSDSFGSVHVSLAYHSLRFLEALQIAGLSSRLRAGG
jgi:hypothetical protein